MYLQYKNSTEKNLKQKHSYPIHTEHPEAYKKISNNMVLVEEGIKYELS